VPSPALYIAPETPLTALYIPIVGFALFVTLKTTPDAPSVKFCKVVDVHPLARAVDLDKFFAELDQAAKIKPAAKRATRKPAAKKVAVKKTVKKKA